MRQAIEREVEREETRKLAIMLINEGYRALAKKAHPDAGGSHATMARLSTLRCSPITRCLGCPGGSGTKSSAGTGRMLRNSANRIK
jgi:hypothetical protein